VYPRGGAGGDTLDAFYASEENTKKPLKEEIETDGRNEEEIEIEQEGGAHEPQT
jgi:hypothetical protein